MPLEPVPLLFTPADLPEEVDELFARADQIERELAVRLTNQPPGGFHPSDYVTAFAALQAIRQSDRLRGTTFCEWGSGTGVITTLAAMLGFDAYGIEVQQELVHAADELSDGRAQFACGSFVLEEAVELITDHTRVTFVENLGDDGFDELGLEPTDVDLVYAYPWPGEREMMEQLFEHTVSSGALLLLSDGDRPYELFRKE